MLSSKPSIATQVLLMVLFVCCGKSIGQTTQGAAYIWSTTTSWTPTGVPTSSGTVTVNHPLTLDQDLTIGTGNYTFNQDVTDQPGLPNYNLTNSNATGSLTIASGTTTIGGVTDIGGNSTFTLTVKNGATLVLGTPGSISNNFLIGNKANITIEQGATLIIYGNIVNSNSSGDFIVNGLLQVYGDYKTDNGNIDINGTTGQFYTTGAMQTQGSSSTIYGSGNECTSNCSGTSLGCGSGGNSYTATILPLSQTVCSGGAIAQMTFTTNAPSSTYQWESSLTAGGIYTPISGQTSSTYTPSSLTVTTWFRMKYTSSASGCGTKYSAPIPVYVSASTYTQSTSGQTVCGGTFGPISVSAFGTSLTYQWFSNTTASNSGGTSISGATSNIYTPSNAISGTKYYYCVINSSCNVPFTTAVSGAFTVNTPTTPIIGTITQPDCVTSTGSVILSGLPASGTIYKTGTVTASYTITGTTMTISGLAAGTYNFSVSNGSCSSSITGDVVINSVTTNTWTSSWDKGTPNSSQKLVFTGNYPPATDPNVDINGCSCMVTGGAEVTIKSGRTLTITNDLTVVGGGTLTFENNASLVQINNVANTGNIIYKRITPSLIETDYAYWSSPVAGQTLNISPDYAYGTFYSYDYSIDNWAAESLSTNMAVGNGYIIRGQKSDNTAYNITGTFIGVPNNGTKTIAVGSTGTSNLLGNPYPSAINADTFLAVNSTILDGTIYLWTHNTAIQLASSITNGTAGSGLYAYTSDDYASYNTTGGVGVGNFANGVEKTTNRPTGKIAAGQAFFTTSKTTGGTVTFNNAMRVLGNNTQFFRTKNPKTKTTTDIEKNRVWLNLTNTEGAFKQALVGYITDATNDYESRFDGESFDGNEYVDFYSINEDKNLVIQGRALPFDEKDEVPLGFRTAIDGAFTINIDEVDGFLVNQSVFLEDKLTNTVTDLKSGNYTFNTTAGTFNDRFVLKYSNKTLGVGTIDKEDGIVVLYSNNYKTLIIHNNGDSTINSVSLFSMTGQNIAVWDVKDSEQTNIQIPIKNISSGIYIVKVKTTDGESSKKIVIR
ncbi:Por secretion system C-terminal sorting domain-containing protein [Flavobacterium fluvii]|uniref:Por secretion system C-terminal sorting domain-containing protein n=2 Tax=Flavobacterium fluvii TaxID=468056 RepID=A0A1M5FCF6_9FLAO|nr:Por secretion system C-terminal sorting domain-containing protein [Flavobacterium fluvii]